MTTIPPTSDKNALPPFSKTDMRTLPPIFSQTTASYRPIDESPSKVCRCFGDYREAMEGFSAMHGKSVTDLSITRKVTVEITDDPRGVYPSQAATGFHRKGPISADKALQATACCNPAYSLEKTEQCFKEISSNDQKNKIL